MNTQQNPPSFAHPSVVATICNNCGRNATKKCTGCDGAPIYTSPDPTVTYCNRGCQTAHWPSHKAQCAILKRRKKLLRAATLLKATLLAYRECVFDIDILQIEFRNGVLNLNLNPRPNHRRPYNTAFPNILTDNVIHKEAALAINQCTLAMALLGPLARLLLAGRISTIAQIRCSIN